MSRNSSTGPKRVLARTIGLVWREERHRRVTPVVDPTRRAILCVKLKHGKQFDGGDAEVAGDRVFSRSVRHTSRVCFSATPELG